MGIMTLTTFFSLYWTGTQTLRQRAAMIETLGAKSLDDLRFVLRRVFLFTIGIEAAGTLILWVRFLADEPPWQALWSAAFHTVAAFCNAGFGLYDDNLTRYQGDPVVNLTIISLIVLGGIGFPVMNDLVRRTPTGWKFNYSHLQLHSKLMLVGTAGLLGGGTVIILAFEWNDVLADLSYADKLFVAFFQSTTTRTAGFNTIAIGQLTEATLFVMILLMMIGAGPCSTAGGFKVSTAMVLLVQSWCKFRGKTKVNVFHRSISPETITRSLVSVMMFSVIGVVGLIFILSIEHSNQGHDVGTSRFLDSFFEVVSALGTVGLTTGITPLLSDPSRLVIIVLMFIGRIGPITTIVVLSNEPKEQFLQYPKEEVLLG
ncbi:MAG: potassium transporter TrkG [Planctomycetota bacterium]